MQEKALSVLTQSTILEDSEDDDIISPPVDSTRGNGFLNLLSDKDQVR